MEIVWALILWLIAVIIVYFLARHFQIGTWSAIFLAITVGFIVLMIARPANTVNWGMNNNSGAAAIYWLITVLSPLIIVIYGFTKALTDRPREVVLVQ